MAIVLNPKKLLGFRIGGKIGGKIGSKPPPPMSA